MSSHALSVLLSLTLLVLIDAIDGDQHAGALDLLVLGVNSDASVKRLKGPERPINNENDRAFVLSQLKSVDFVEIFTEDTPLNLILTVKPDALVKGGDWKIDQIVGGKEVQANGGQVYSLNFVDGYSTTNIIEKIQHTD